MKIKSVRGTHDLFGVDIEKHNKIRKTVSQFAKINNFIELQTPIFEFTELFSKPLGEQSDVVLKEMYTFKDRNDEFLTLRPEYTTPMIRAAISNNLLNSLPLKVYGIGPMFRRERPQKGRYRQFNQINFEILGSKDYISDLELISMGNDILKSIIPETKYVLNINSLGNREDLANYKILLRNFFSNNKKNLSEESKLKINLNPLRILDSKMHEDIDVCKNAPLIQDFISKESKSHFLSLKKSLDYYGIKYYENNNLVRGLDYYCSTVFEFKTDDLGSQATLLGGGRYDGLINTLGGPDITGIGWAAGIERIAMLMNNEDNNLENVHIAINSENFKDYLMKIMKYLKDNNISFYWNYKYNLKKSLSKANLDKAKYIIIIGENEFKNEFYTVRNLITGEQTELDVNNISSFINDKS